jgi:glycerol-3-phosphate dehydrogenase
VVPQRRSVVIGTTSWTVGDPDHVAIPAAHVELMFERGAELVPLIRGAERRGVFAASRPLIGRKVDLASGRELSRTFECFDHSADDVHGFVTIGGGKTTTARAMAETTAEVVCSQLHVDAPGRTAVVPLRSYRDYYHG